MQNAKNVRNIINNNINILTLSYKGKQVIYFQQILLLKKKKDDNNNAVTIIVTASVMTSEGREKQPHITEMLNCDGEIIEH